MPIAEDDVEYYLFCMNVNPKSEKYGLIKRFVTNDEGEELIGDLKKLLRSGH